MPEDRHTAARERSQVRRSLAPWVALALAFGALPSAPRAQDTPPAQAAEPDADGFAREYEAAARMMTARNWKAAHEAWLVLLRRHAGKDYVQAKVEEIRAGLRKSAFWQVTKEPDPKALVSGGLRSFMPSSGQIEILYDRGKLADFTHPLADQNEKTFGLSTRPVLYMHPITFRGNYSLELQGSPEELMNVTPYVALDLDQGYVVQIGGRKGLEIFYHRLLHVRGAGSDVVAQRTPDEPAKKARSSKPKPVRVLIQVDSKSITVQYDGDKLFDVPNERGELGHWGLLVAGDFGVVDLKGKIEPSWIDGLQDAFVQSAREDFERSYEDPPELAPWADARPASTAAERIEHLLAHLPLPGKFLPGQLALIDEVDALRSQGRAREAVSRLDALRGVLPDDARALLLALCEIEAHRPARALERLDDYDDMAGLSPSLKFLQAHLLGQVEREAEAIEVLNGLAAADASEPLVPYELTQELISTGRFAEARAALERGAAASAPLVELAELRTQLVKATLGPEWKKSFTQGSERFAVSSDLDNDSCRAAVRELDEAWGKCGEWFGALAPPAAPTKVYLFSGQASYDGYVRGIASEGLANTLGAYSIPLDQIVAWNSSDRELLLRTLRHECVHRYLDVALGQVPIWFGEGLAEVLAASKLPSRKWAEGAPNEYALVVLRDASSSLTPLETFLRLDPEGFMQNAELHYPEAWAFVHFLRRGNDPAATAFLARLWKELAGRTDALSAVETALEGVDVKALEQHFLAYVQQLLRGADGAKPR